MSDTPTVPQTQQPTTITGAALALINSIFAMGVLLNWWMLSAPQIAGIQLVFGNLFLVIGVVAVQSHTSTKTETKMAVEAAKDDAP